MMSSMPESSKQKCAELNPCEIMMDECCDDDFAGGAGGMCMEEDECDL